MDRMENIYSIEPLGLDLAQAVMEIGKKSKTALVLFLKYSTLIWKQCHRAVGQ